MYRAMRAGAALWNAPAKIRSSMRSTARARVRGYQKPDEDGFMRIAGCAKHYCAYGAVLSGRDYGEVDVSQRALEEVYLPPFRAVVRRASPRSCPRSSTWRALR